MPSSLTAQACCGRSCGRAAVDKWCAVARLVVGSALDGLPEPALVCGREDSRGLRRRRVWHQFLDLLVTSGEPGPVWRGRGEWAGVGGSRGGEPAPVLNDLVGQAQLRGCERRQAVQDREPLEHVLQLGAVPSGDGEGEVNAENGEDVGRARVAELVAVG